MGQEPQWSADKQWWWDGGKWVPEAEARISWQPQREQDLGTAGPQRGAQASTAPSQTAAELASPNVPAPAPNPTSTPTANTSAAPSTPKWAPKPALTTPTESDVNQTRWSDDRRWWWDGQKWIAAAQVERSVGRPLVKKKGHAVRNSLIALGVLIVAGIWISIATSGGGSNTNNTASTQASSQPSTQATTQPTSQATAAASAAPSAAQKPSAPAGPVLTNQQQNAARAAQQYLALTGFSRQGLIDQLSSSFGDQYSVQDATTAVDSLNVDWNAEAVRAAKAYLKLTPFSCQGLIDQLDSQYGDKFTVAQATYGAQQAGAC